MHVPASWGHGPDSMSNSKSNAKRRARRWRGPGNPSCPHPLPASSACARRLCCGSPPCRSGSRSPPSSPVSLAEGLPALTSLCLQKHHTLLSLSSSKAEGDSAHLALATTEEGAGHRASMWISVAWPLFVSPSIHSHSQPPPGNLVKGLGLSLDPVAPLQEMQRKSLSA